MEQILHTDLIGSRGIAVSSHDSDLAFTEKKATPVSRMRTEESRHKTRSSPLATTLLRIAYYKIHLQMALSQQEECSNKGLFNGIMLHPYENDPTFESHHL